MKRLITLVVFALAASDTSHAHAQTFAGLGIPAAHSKTAAAGVGAGGLIVAGTTDADTTTESALVWGNFSGIQQLSPAPTFLGSKAYAISANGLVTVGHSSHTGVPVQYVACRWTGPAPSILNSLAGATFSAAFATNSDGSVSVGVSDATGASGHAVRWIGGAMGIPTDLGVLPGAISSLAYGVSGDGSVVVGNSPVAGLNRAFRWTQAGGMVDLGVAGPLSTTSFARACNTNGSVVVGDSNNLAFRWTQATGMVGLGAPIGHGDSIGLAVSGDGNVIVGYSGVGSSTPTAIMWGAPNAAGGVTGWVDLNNYLPTLGINLSGWTLSQATSISTDGRTIAGYGVHTALLEAWVATIPARPAPPAACPADFNHSGTLDVQDIFDFINSWLGGC